jgi:hypothetical protein
VTVRRLLIDVGLTAGLLVFGALVVVLVVGLATT